MQSVSSRIWTRVAVSISYDDNHYTTGTFIIYISTTTCLEDPPEAIDNIDEWSERVREI